MNGYWEAGERIGERVFLRLLEDDRVVNHRCSLFAHAIEQATMVVPVEACVDVVDANRADEAIVNHQWADER
jgi:hypothetical protein